MIEHTVVEGSGEVWESGAWVNETYTVLVASSQWMSTDWHAHNIKLVIRSNWTGHVQPLNRLNVSVGVEPADAENTAISAQTQVEHLLWYHFRGIHGFVYRHLLRDCYFTAHAHAENAISSLVVKHVCFFRNASESELEGVMTLMVLVAKVGLIWDHKALIAWPLLIGLMELAPPVEGTLAFIFSTFVDVSRWAGVEVVPLIDVRTARVDALWVDFAIVFARHRCHAGTCIYNQGLLLFLASKKQIDVEILQISAVSVQATWL